MIVIETEKLVLHALLLEVIQHIAKLEQHVLYNEIIVHGDTSPGSAGKSCCAEECLNPALAQIGNRKLMGWINIFILN